MRLTPRHREDFAAYVQVRGERGRPGDFCPWSAPDVPHGTLDPCEAFHVHDSTGRIVGSADPAATQAAMEGKRLLNFNIRQWAEGYFDCGGMTGLREILAERALPEWVGVAVRAQAYRTTMQ